MKKCSGCEKEIDKYAIACQYCGKLTQDEINELVKELHEPDENADKEDKKEE